MKLEAGHLVRLRNGKVTFIAEVHPTAVYAVTTRNGFTYTRKGELRMGETDERDIISIEPIEDGIEYKIGKDLYVTYNNKIYKQENYGRKYDKS